MSSLLGGKVKSISIEHKSLAGIHYYQGALLDVTGKPVYEVTRMSHEAVKQSLINYIYKLPKVPDTEVTVAGCRELVTYIRGDLLSTGLYSEAEADQLYDIIYTVLATQDQIAIDSLLRSRRGRDSRNERGGRK